MTAALLLNPLESSCMSSFTTLHVVGKHETAFTRVKITPRRRAKRV